MGVTLWLLGAKLLRGSTAISSLMLGGLTGFIAAEQMAAGQLTVLWIIGGAVTGCLLAWLLFRLWMGITIAIMLAIAAPTAMMVLDNVAPPPITAQQAELPDTIDPLKLGNSINPFSPNGITGGGERSGGVELDEEQLQQRVDSVVMLINETVQRQGQAISGWWSDLGSSTRRGIQVTSALGAIVGLVLGLLLPHLSAAFLTSFSGSLLMLTGSTGLLAFYSPNQIQQLQLHPRVVVITLCLITAIGTLIQWTIWRKKTDK